MAKRYDFLKLLGLGSLLLASSVSMGQFMEYDGHQYKVMMKSRVSWDQAQVYVDRLGDGWHLATITSEEENMAVKEMLQGKPGEYWIGGVQEAHAPARENWEWVTGERFDFTDWHRGEPNNFRQVEEQHLAMWGFYDWEWNDEGELRNIFGYIIERTIGEEEETTTVETSSSPNSIFSGAPELSIYPNPNNGEFNFQFSDGDAEGLYTMRIVNVIGKQVFSQQVQVSNGMLQKRVSLRELPTGTYFLQLTDGRMSITKKFILSE